MTAEQERAEVVVSKKLFSFRFEIEETLSVKDIWPDGDAPENPTADDVRKVFMNSCRGNVIRGMEDWGLLDSYSSEYDIDIVELKPMRPPMDIWRQAYELFSLAAERWENEGGR